MKRIAVMISVMFFFAVACIGWACGLTPFACGTKAAIAAIALYVVIRIAGGMAGNLFMRSLERSDRIYVAMLSRGYDGEMRSMPLPEMKVSNWLALIVGGMILSLLMILSFLVGG